MLAFIENPDLPPGHRSEESLIGEALDIVDPPKASAVDLQNIEVATLTDTPTICALSARFAVAEVSAVHGHREDACQCGLACPGVAKEDIAVDKSPALAKMPPMPFWGRRRNLRHLKLL